MSNNCK